MQSKLSNLTARAKQATPTVKDPELEQVIADSIDYERVIAKSKEEYELAQAIAKAKKYSAVPLPSAPPFQYQYNEEVLSQPVQYQYNEEVLPQPPLNPNDGFPPLYIYNPLDPNEQPPSIKLPNPPGFFESIIRRFWSGGDLSKQNIDPYYLRYLKYKNKYIDLKNNTN